MPTSNISDNYTITNYTGSLAENRVRDPDNDVAGAAATASIQLLGTGTDMLDPAANPGANTITITDHNGLEKVYIFDDDGDGDTGTVDGSGRVRVQITGVDKDAFATQLKTAITGPTGHNGTITITGPGLEYTGDGKINLTQSSGGTSGNKTIQTTLAGGISIISGFSPNNV